MDTVPHDDYAYDSDVDNGAWYVDDDWLLYIIPTEEHGIQENLGPDNAVMDAINAICRTGRRTLTEMECTQLGLHVIYRWQHRFNPHDGWYHC